MTGADEHSAPKDDQKDYFTELTEKFAVVDLVVQEFDAKIHEKINEIKKYRSNLEESIKKFKEKRNKKMREIYDIVSSL